MYESPGLVLNCFVLFMIADLRHVNKLIEDLKTFRHSEIEFHPWSAIKDSKQRNTKVGIINNMNTFAAGHISILIRGLKENSLMRVFFTKPEGDDDQDLPETFVEACTMDDDLFTEKEQDLNYSLQQL